MNPISTDLISLQATV